MQSILDTLTKILPILISKTTRRLDNDEGDYRITAYWVGDVIRIDIKRK